MMRLETAFDIALAESLRDLHGRRQPFERDLAEIVVFEEAVHETPRTLRNNDLTRLCDSLQTPRQGRCLTYSDTFFHRTGGEFIADYHDPSGDPDAGFQLRVEFRTEARCRSPKRQRGAHGILGVPLIGLGIAEIGEHNAAGEATDVTMVALDDLDAMSATRRRRLAQILRIEARRQRHQAGQLA